MLLIRNLKKSGQIELLYSLLFGMAAAVGAISFIVDLVFKGAMLPNTIFVASGLFIVYGLLSAVIDFDISYLSCLGLDFIIICLWTLIVLLNRSIPALALIVTIGLILTHFFLVKMLAGSRIDKNNAKLYDLMRKTEYKLARFGRDDYNLSDLDEVVQILGTGYKFSPEIYEDAYLWGDLINKTMEDPSTRKSTVERILLSGGWVKAAINEYNESVKSEFGYEKKLTAE